MMIPASQVCIDCLGHVSSTIHKSDWFTLYILPFTFFNHKILFLGKLSENGKKREDIFVRNRFPWKQPLYILQSTPTRVLPPPLYPPQQSAVKIDISRNQQIKPRNPRITINKSNPNHLEITITNRNPRNNSPKPKISGKKSQETP